MRFTLFLTALFALAATACGPAEDPAELPPTQLAELARAEDLRLEGSPQLIEALKNGSPEVRQRAARAMGRIQSATYAPSLAAASGPAEPADLRRGALFALGQLGLAEGVSVPPEAVGAVRQALGDADPAIVAAGAQALGKLAPPDAAGALVELLRHASPEVREQAAYGLFRLRFAPVWRKEAKEPPPLPAAAVDATVAALADEDVRVRRAAAHTFSRYGQEEARPALAAALDDGDELVRLFAARALGKAGDGPGGEALRSHLNDPSAAVRGEVVRALAALGAAELLPESLAEDTDFQVRAAAALAWGGSAQAGSQAGSERALAGLLEDASPTVQSAAIEALARRRGEAFAPSLKAIFETGTWTSRVAAARGARHTGSAAREILDRALGDDDARVQAAALESLDELSQDDGATERIAAALASEDLAVRGAAVTALADRRHPKKIEWLKETVSASPGVDWIEIREGVVAALHEEDGAEDGGGEDLLRRLAADPAPSVARRARLALEGRGLAFDPQPVPDDSSKEPSPFLATTFSEAPTVVLETEKGNLEILTLAQEAPLHVASFIRLVKEGFYDGLIWHRVVPNFVVQGGDPLGNGWGGPGYALRDEIHPTPFERGSVGMPKAGKDTGGCQIFITHIPTPHLDGNYTIFGRVVSGLEVVDRIEVGDRILRAYVRD